LPASVDSFAIGALFALVQKGMLTIPNKWKEARIQWLLGMIFFLFSQIWTCLPLSKNWNLAFYLCLLSLSFGCMILAACHENESTTKPSLLNNRILIYLGKISYGLYLYHNFIPYFFDLNVPGLPDNLILYAVQMLRFGVLVIIASISWFLIEKPILRLKDKLILLK
jgi:peptidoglycan/LPS O-acetylase OafA/YrhL